MMPHKEKDSFVISNQCSNALEFNMMSFTDDVIRDVRATINGHSNILKYKEIMRIGLDKIKVKLRSGIVNVNGDAVSDFVSPHTEDNNGGHVEEIKKKFKIQGGHELWPFTLNEAVKTDDYKLAVWIFCFNIISRYTKFLILTSLMKNAKKTLYYLT